MDRYNNYDKQKQEKQLLRDALIRTLRELRGGIGQKERLEQETFLKLKHVDIGRSFCIGKRRTAIWLPLTKVDEIGIITKLGIGDILISSDLALCGKLICGVPVCSFEALKNLCVRPFVLIHSCVYQVAKAKLQEFGYEEHFDFDWLDVIFEKKK